LKDAKPGDTLVLFIAGHGIHDTDAEGTYYFATYDAELSRLGETAARFELIEDILQGIAPRNKLFLMDTCESGELEEGVQATMFAQAGSRGIIARTARGIAVKAVPTSGNASAAAAAPAGAREYLAQRDRYIYNDLARRSGAIVFSSCKGGEFSYESEAVAKLSGGLQHPTVDRDNLYQKFGFPALKQ